MPNEQMNTIIYENNNLRKQLEMQRIAFTQQIDALKEQLANREAELKMQIHAG